MLRVERGRGDVVQEMSARWRLFMMASSDASSSSSSSPAPECVSCREMDQFWLRTRLGWRQTEQRRFAIVSERVVDGTTVDPPLPLRRKVASDEQLEVMKEDELYEEEFTWTLLDMVE